MDTKIGILRDYRSLESLIGESGRGGTDMRVGIGEVWKMKPRPALCLVLTDGQTPWPDQAGPVPVIAGIVGSTQNYERAVVDIPAWMRHLEVDTSSKDNTPL